MKTTATLPLIVLLLTSAHTVMSNTIPEGFTHKVIAPEGRTFLTSRVLLHKDFQVMDVLSEEVDFENPDTMLPMMVAATPYGPMVFSVAARPAYGDGSVSQWLGYLCRKEGYEHSSIERTKIGIHPAVVCDARQQGDGVVMRMRMVLLENGGRMVSLTAMAPEELWTATEARLQVMLDSFEFAEDRGATTALMPDDEPPARQEVSEETSGQVTDADVEPQGATESETPSARLTDTELAELVLADDTDSLDPDHRINANLRDRGVGLVPNILHVDQQSKTARVAAGAIEAVIRLPFGWHAIDDGRRTLVFDADGRIQVNLDQRHGDGARLAELARSFIAPYLEKQPDLEFIEMDFGDVHAIAVRGLEVDDEILDQAFMLRDVGRDGLVLVARATGAAEHSRGAMNLAGDILATVETMEALAAKN